MKKYKSKNQTTKEVKAKPLTVTRKTEVEIRRNIELKKQVEEEGKQQELKYAEGKYKKNRGKGEINEDVYPQSDSHTETEEDPIHRK